jgi:hypothetical protein
VSSGLAEAVEQALEAGRRRGAICSCDGDSQPGAQVSTPRLPSGPTVGPQPARLLRRGVAGPAAGLLPWSYLQLLKMELHSTSRARDPVVRQRRLKLGALEAFSASRRVAILM